MGLTKSVDNLSKDGFKKAKWMVNNQTGHSTWVHPDQVKEFTDKGYVQAERKPQEKKK